jgi:hypothetical protein
MSLLVLLDTAQYIMSLWVQRCVTCKNNESSKFIGASGAMEITVLEFDSYV